MWIEINDGEKEGSSTKKTPKWDISEKPSEEFQIRVCILDGEDVKMMDSEGTVDCYFRCYFEGDNKDALETDTHFRN